MRTTLTLNDTVYKFVKRQAIDESLSFSGFIEKVLVEKFVGKGEITNQELDRRLKEPTITHQELLQQLKSEGLL